VPQHIVDLASFLVREGWDVHVLSGGTTGDARHDGYWVYKDARSAVVRRLATAGFLASLVRAGRAGPAFSVRRALPARAWGAVLTRASIGARIIARHDIRVISAYNLLGGMPVGAVLARMFELPLVVTNLGEIYSHRAEVTRQRALIRQVTAEAAALLAPTEHCARSYRELDLAPAVEVIHHGIDVRRFTPSVDAGEMRRTLRLGSKDEVVLFVGRLVRDMGVETLIAAAPAMLERRPSMRLVIAGGSGDLLPAARQLAERLPGRLMVVADVPAENLPALYAGSTVLVVPTLGARACGSLAAAEAMACGRPVVASRVGGIPEFVVDGETGVLVPPGDPRELSAAVHGLLDDPERRAAMGRAGRQRAEAMFDAETTNRAFGRVFRRVAAR
jgi:glycosyltransferase involved in cell wall biosynthesis